MSGTKCIVIKIIFAMKREYFFEKSMHLQRYGALREEKARGRGGVGGKARLVWMLVACSACSKQRDEKIVGVDETTTSPDKRG